MAEIKEYVDRIIDIPQEMRRYLDQWSVPGECWC